VLDTDTQVIERIESGEWRLIKEEAYYFDGRGIKAEVKERRVLGMMRSPPPQIKVDKVLFRILDSVTGEPISSCNFFMVIDGERTERRTDARGATYLPKTQEQIKSLSITFLVRNRSATQ
jgi:hypothetical protein